MITRPFGPTRVRVSVVGQGTSRMGESRAAEIRPDARQVALNFLTRRPSLFTIPKASRPEHVRENAAALDFALAPADLKC